MIVLDASALTAWLLRLAPAAGIDFAVRRAGRIALPDHAHLEVTSAFRRQVLHGNLDHARAALAFERLQGLRAAVHSTWPLLGRVWELRGSLSIYDAAYVALAEALAVPLLTTDGRLARAPGHRASVIDAR